MPVPPNRPGGPAGLETRPPDPRQFKAWQDYALALGGWQDRQRLVSMGVQPEAVMLLAVTTSDTARARPVGVARATTPGILVYDPAKERVQMSTGDGTWHSMANAGDGGGATGPAGPTGPTGPTGATGATGPGVAPGGSTGQVLTKTSATDYATNWQTPASGSGTYLPLAGGSMTGVLRVANGTPAAPGLAFVPEVNTGWYMPGLGAVRTVAAGTDVFQCATGAVSSFVPLDVGTASAASLRFQRTGNPNLVSVPDGASLRVTNASNVAWATVSSASGWVAGVSDIRLKDNVQDIHYGLDTVMQLRAVEFDRKADGVHDLGLVSQEVQPIIPEVIEEAPGEEGEETYLFLRKDALVPVLVKAVQELALRVQALAGAA